MRSAAIALAVLLAASASFCHAAEGEITDQDLITGEGTGAVTNLVPGDGLPILEVKGDGEWLRSGVEFILHHKGKTRSLGFLTKGLTRAYKFTPGPYSETKDKVLATLSPPGMIGNPDWSTFNVYTGDEALQLGRLHDKMIFGSGINVYREGSDKKVGYVDEKTWQSVKNAFTKFDAKKPFVFSKVTWTEEPRMVGIGKFKKQVGTKDVDRETPAFVFIDNDVQGWGADGVFLDMNQRPFLLIKGKWWMSTAAVFDFWTSSRESSGKVGKILNDLGKAAAELSGDAQAANDIRAAESQLVRNPTACIGAFIVSLVYFRDFREAVKVDISVPSID